MSLLNFKFFMIYIIYKMLVLLKITWIILKTIFSNAFLGFYIDFYFFIFSIISFTTYNDESCLEEENIIKDTRNLFRLKKELNYTSIKDIRKLFRREKETKVIKDRILIDIKNIFEHEEEENYYKSVRVSKFWSNNTIEYKSNSDRNKALSVEEYLNIIRPYQKDIMNNLKKWQFN